MAGLERQMEQATAPAERPGGPMDEETASLGEAWLAFGQLLEAAQPSAGLARPMPHASPPPARSRWSLPKVLALAASLLVAIAVAWKVRGSKPSPDPAGPSGQVAGVEPRQSAPANGQSPSVPPQTELAWNDTLDNEIALAGQAVMSVREDRLGLAGAASSVEYGLQQLEKDIQDSPL